MEGAEEPVATGPLGGIQARISGLGDQPMPLAAEGDPYPIEGINTQTGLTWQIDDCHDSECWRYGPSVSPDGQRVVYGGGPGGPYDNIYINSMAGGQERRIFPAPGVTDAGGDEPQWSPDNRHIYFEGWDGNKGGIFVVGADGSNPHLIYSGYTYDWSVTPQGDIVMVQWATPGLWRIDPDSGVATLETNFSEYGELGSQRSYDNPRVSPDGQWMTLEAAPGPPNYGPSSQWVVSLTTNAAWRISSPPPYMSSAVYSPDGRYLYFDRYYPIADQGIYRMSSSGGPAELVIAGHRGAPSVPQASSIAQQVGQTRIQSVAANGSDRANPVNLSSSSGRHAAPDVSPDGKRIVYAGTDADHERSGIYIAEGDGRNVDRLDLGNGIDEAFRPRFSADGARILFSASEVSSGVRSVWSVSPDGSNLHRVKSDEASYETVQASPDSQSIIATRSGATSLGPQTWLMGADGRDARQLVPGSAQDASYGWRARTAVVKPAVDASFVRDYAPYVRQDGDDGFYPIRVGWIEKLRNPANQGPCIHDGDHCVTPLRFPLAATAGNGEYIEYPAKNNIDEQRRLVNDAFTRAGRSARHSPQHAEPFGYYYVSPKTPDGLFVIQYWYFWTYNYWNWGMGNHEGDFEHVQILFDKNSEPFGLTMSRHDKVNWFKGSWDLPSLEKQGTHLIVRAAHGSHGFYANCSLRHQLFVKKKGVKVPRPDRGDQTCFGMDRPAPYRNRSDVTVASPRNVVGALANLTREWSCWNGQTGNGGPQTPLRQTDAHGARALCAKAAGQ